MTKLDKFWLYFPEILKFLKILMVQIFSSKKKLGSWKESSLYSILWICGTVFWIFDFFLDILLIMSKILDMSIFSKILDIFPKKSKIQNSVTQIFRYHIEVTPDQISASWPHFWRENTLPTWFWENFCARNSQNLTDYVKIENFVFLLKELPSFIKTPLFRRN